MKLFVKSSILQSIKLRPHSYSRPGRSPQNCVQTSKNIHEQTQVHTNRLMSSSTFFGQLRRAIFPGNLLPDLRRYCPVRNTEKDIYHIYLISYNHIRSSYAMSKYHKDDQDHNESDRQRDGLISDTVARAGSCLDDDGQTQNV